MRGELTRANMEAVADASHVFLAMHELRDDEDDLATPAERAAFNGLLAAIGDACADGYSPAPLDPPARTR